MNSGQKQSFVRIRKLVQIVVNQRTEQFDTFEEEAETE